MKAILLWLFLSGLPGFMAAQAQEFPTKPVRWIMPFLAGSVPDNSVRLLQEQISSTLGKPIVIDNRPGGAGVPAASEMLRSAPDGHTLLGLDAGHYAILPAMRSDLPYNVLRDFVPVALIFSTPQFVVVRDSLGVRDLRELIALIRSKPGALQHGSNGTGSVNHLRFENFKAPLGLEVLHVPYKGSVEFIPALLRGDISMAMIGLTSVHSLVKSGQLKLLASSGRTRFRLTSDIPTIAEAGGPPDFDLTARFVVVTLSGTPAPVIEKISTAVLKAQSIPEVAARALAAGYELTPAGPQRLAEIMSDDIKAYRAAVRNAGIAETR